RSRKRSFRSTSSLSFDILDNFVLTSAGSVFARKTLIETGRISALLPLDESAKSVVTPRWDRNSRTLYVGDDVVKRFHVPAGNQDVILTAFQEEGWPSCID